MANRPVVVDPGSLNEPRGYMGGVEGGGDPRL